MAVSMQFPLRNLQHRRLNATAQGLIAMMAQLFYARRILVLTKKRWLFTIVVLTSVVAGCECLFY